MAILRAQVVTPADSGNPADEVTNTWHFEADSTAGSILDSITTALDAFYTAHIGALSSAMDWVNTRIRFFDLGDTPPRQPIRDAVMAISGTPGVPLPPELAVVMSFRASLASGGNPQRRHGRVFIGPLSQSVMSTTAGQQHRISTTYVTAFAQDGDNLLAASDTATDWSWAVYSRADGIARPVVAGWVDDAFDIQRRRGVEATSRVAFS